MFIGLLTLTVIVRLAETVVVIIDSSISAIACFIINILVV